MNDAELLSLVFVAVMVAFYLMFIRPIHKDQEKHRQQIRDLRPGDEVVTTSNFVAKILEIEVREDGQTRLSLELANGVVVTALPAAILQRLAPAPAQHPSPSTAPEREPSSSSTQTTPAPTSPSEPALRSAEGSTERGAEGVRSDSGQAPA